MPSIECIPLDKSEAQKLMDIDALVDLGVARDLATSMVSMVHSAMDGHFRAFLETPNNITDQVERVFIRTMMVAAVSQWLEHMQPYAETAQVIALGTLIARNTKD